MQTRRWLNQSQPQTLVSATLLLYLNAVFALIQFGPLKIFLLLGAVAAYGIANDNKWGYYAGIAIASLNLLLVLLLLPGNGLRLDILISVAFAALLVVLLLHQMSRDYQRLWFK